MPDSNDAYDPTGRLIIGYDEEGTPFAMQMDGGARPLGAMEHIALTGRDIRQAAPRAVLTGLTGLPALARGAANLGLRGLGKAAEFVNPSLGNLGFEDAPPLSQTDPLLGNALDWATRPSDKLELPEARTPVGKVANAGLMFGAGAAAFPGSGVGGLLSDAGPLTNTLVSGVNAGLAYSTADQFIPEKFRSEHPWLSRAIPFVASLLPGLAGTQATREIGKSRRVSKAMDLPFETPEVQGASPIDRELAARKLQMMSGDPGIPESQLTQAELRDVLEQRARVQAASERADELFPPGARPITAVTLAGTGTPSLVSETRAAGTRDPFFAARASLQRSRSGEAYNTMVGELQRGGTGAGVKESFVGAADAMHDAGSAAYKAAEPFLQHPVDIQPIEEGVHDIIRNLSVTEQEMGVNTAMQSWLGKLREKFPDGVVPAAELDKEISRLGKVAANSADPVKQYMAQNLSSALYEGIDNAITETGDASLLSAKSAWKQFRQTYTPSQPSAQYRGSSLAKINQAEQATMVGKITGESRNYVDLFRVKRPAEIGRKLAATMGEDGLANVKAGIVEQLVPKWDPELQRMTLPINTSLSTVRSDWFRQGYTAAFGSKEYDRLVNVLDAGRMVGLFPQLGESAGTLSTGSGNLAGATPSAIATFGLNKSMMGAARVGLRGGFDKIMQSLGFQKAQWLAHQALLDDRVYRDLKLFGRIPPRDWEELIQKHIPATAARTATTATVKEAR